MENCHVRKAKCQNVYLCALFTCFQSRKNWPHSSKEEEEYINKVNGIIDLKRHA
jgi:hypothetical protein